MIALVQPDYGACLDPSKTGACVSAFVASLTVEDFRNLALALATLGMLGFLVLGILGLLVRLVRRPGDG